MKIRTICGSPHNYMPIDGFFFGLLLLSYRVTPCYFSSLPFYYVSNNV